MFSLELGFAAAGMVDMVVDVQCTGTNSGKQRALQHICRTNLILRIRNKNKGSAYALIL